MHRFVVLTTIFTGMAMLLAPLAIKAGGRTPAENAQKLIHQK
jgi:hypothetical protein